MANVKVDTITVESAAEAIAKLTEIQDPEGTLVVMTSALYEDVRKASSKPPREDYIMPDGRPCKNLVGEVFLFDCYTLRTKQVQLDTGADWYVVMALFSVGSNKSFIAKEANRVVILAKRDFSVSMNSL